MEITAQMIRDYHATATTHGIGAAYDKAARTYGSAGAKELAKAWRYAELED